MGEVEGASWRGSARLPLVFFEELSESNSHPVLSTPPHGGGGGGCQSLIVILL